MNVTPPINFPPSKTSMMVAGLLDTLSKDEFLELLAYLATGDKN